MPNRTIASIQPNEVVNCKTKKEAVAFCQMWSKNPKKWIKYWDKYKSYTCYDVNNGSFGNTEYFLSEDYTILPASLFLEQDPVELDKAKYDGWVRCSTGLPDTARDVLITNGLTISRGWYSDGWVKESVMNILAWRELPTIPQSLIDDLKNESK